MLEDSLKDEQNKVVEINKKHSDEVQQTTEFQLQLTKKYWEPLEHIRTVNKALSQNTAEVFKRFDRIVFENNKQMQNILEKQQNVMEKTSVLNSKMQSSEISNAFKEEMQRNELE